MAEFTNLSSMKVAGKVETSAQGLLIGSTPDHTKLTNLEVGAVVLNTTDNNYYKYTSTGWIVSGSFIDRSDISDEIDADVKVVSDALTTAKSALQKEIDELEVRHDNEMDAIEGRATTLEGDVSSLKTRADGVDTSISTLNTDKADKDELAGYVPTGRTVNGKALSGNITLSAADVGALASGATAAAATKATQDGNGNVITTTYATKTELNDAVVSAAGAVYKVKGTKANYSDLPTVGNITGDVWNVINANGNTPAGTNYVWTGTEWDALGGTMDLTKYALSQDLSGHVGDNVRHITAEERNTWNGKADSSTVSTLSTNLSNLQAQVDGLVIPDGVTVDTALSTTSPNPVQNKVITTRINALESTVNGKEVPLTFNSPLTRSGNTVTHTNSGVTANTYGSSTVVPRITVDAAGHITGVTSETIVMPTKVSELTNDSEYVTSSGLNTTLEGYQTKGNYVTSDNLTSTLGSYQPKLTFDTTPTANSTNPVTSGGVLNAINTREAKLTWDDAPTSGSSNPVKSGGVFTALSSKAAASDVTALSTKVTNLETYAITSAGTAGQVWTSDGSGAGKWADAASGSSGSNFISINGYAQQYQWLLETTFMLSGTLSVNATEYKKLNYDTFNAERTKSLTNGTAYIRDVSISTSLWEDNTMLHKFVGAIESLINAIPNFIKINGDFTGTINIAACPYKLSASDHNMTIYDDFFCQRSESPQITLNYKHSMLQNYTTSYYIYASSVDSDYLPDAMKVVVCMGWYVEVISVSGTFA